MFQETEQDDPVFLKAAGVQNIPESRHSDVQMLTVWKSTFELTVKHIHPAIKSKLFQPRD